MWTILIVPSRLNTEEEKKFITLQKSKKMESSGIKFKAALLATFALLSEPGKFKVKVLNNVTEKNLFMDESGSRYIVGLRAISADKAAQVASTFQGKEEVDIEETNGLFMTHSIWVNGDQKPELPMKGEEVEITVGYVANRDGEEVLRVTNLRCAAAKKAAAFSLQAITQNAEVEQSA